MIEGAHKIRVDNNNYKKSYIQFDMQRDVSYLSALSLKINQSELYRFHDANYGVLIGRVIANGGFGVPNAKISVFIPLSDEDAENPLISEIYPYKTPNDFDSKGRRYNLLPAIKENGQNDCYTPTGSFPTMNQLLDNNVEVEIFEKYYRYTATTNDSGDYMIMGIPVGNQNIHVDIDLSDIGFLSQKPIELIANGASENLFDSYVKFKASNDLDSLAQIQTINTSREIYPLWGQNNDTVGLNRLDLKLPVNITPTAYIVFGNMTDSSKGTLSRNCRPRKRTGRNCELTTSEGEVTLIRRVSELGNEIEILQNQSYQIDENGNAVFAVPLNLERKITDEAGNLIPSPNANIGVPTSAKIRMKVSLSGSINGFKKRTANYLIPNLYNDFRFGNDTLDRDFFEIRWKKIYTVANYIPRVQRNTNENNENFVGLKQIGQCESNLSIPFNRVRGQFNFIYSIFCTIINVFVAIADAIDSIISLVPGSDGIDFPCGDVTYEDARDWRDECVMPALADFFNIIEYEFYNDFLIGSLYHMKYRFKFRFKRSREALYYKYCAYNCRDLVGPDDPSYVNRCKVMNTVDVSKFNVGTSYFSSGQATRSVDRGLIVEYNNEFFYAARNDVEINEDNAPDLNLSANQTEKNKLLFATTFKEIGSSVQCDIEGVPYIVSDIEPSSFADSENFNYIIDLGGFSACFNPNNVNVKNAYNASQYGIDLLGGDEDDFDANEYYLDVDNETARDYLCSTFSLFGSVNVYSSNVYNTVNNNETPPQSFDLVEDNCAAIQSNSPVRSLTPYFHYFGLIDGKTSMDRAKNSYFANCES